MRMLAVLFFAIATAVAQPAHRRSDLPSAIWSPPKVELPLEWPHPTIPNPTITQISVAGAPIALERTDLEAIRKHFGVVAGKRGDAGDFVAWLCFYGKDDGGLWGLWLTSSEIDGSAIGGFIWQRLPAGARMDHRCKLLDRAGPSITLPIALHLGMSESHVEAVLGRPSAEYHRTSIYVHRHYLTLHNEPYTADNTALLSYRNGELWSVAVDYTISS